MPCFVCAQMARISIYNWNMYFSHILVQGSDIFNHNLHCYRFQCRRSLYPNKHLSYRDDGPIEQLRVGEINVKLN